MLMVNELIGFGVGGGYVDQIPLMTAGTTAGCTISATTEVTAAWNVGDNSNATFWQRNATSGIITAQFTTGFVCKKYTVGTRDSSVGLEPKDWTFEGSNDGVGWTVLDTQAGVTSWALGEVKPYPIGNTTFYTYYRLNITAGNSASFLQIAEWEIMALI